MAPEVQIGAIRQNAQAVAPLRFAGRCDLRWQPKGATAFTCTFFFTQFHPLSVILPRHYLAEICSHEGQTEASAASGAWMPLCYWRGHTGLHRGNRAAFSYSAFSLFSIPQFLRCSLFVYCGAIRKLYFSFLYDCGILDLHS